jgi:hypothetical protein
MYILIAYVAYSRAYYTYLTMLYYTYTLYFLRCRTGPIVVERAASRGLE